MIRGIRWKAPWLLTFVGILAVVSFTGLGQVSQQESQTSPQGAGGSGVPQGGAATGGVGFAGSSLRMVSTSDLKIRIERDRKSVV